MIMKFLKIILFTFSILFVANVNAQKPKPTTVKVIKPIKPIKFISSIGGYKNNDMLPLVIADSIIGLPLKITDEKNKVYEISSYEFLYRKNVMSEDEDTMKTYKTTTARASLFKATPLTDKWLVFVREELKQGEELHFFNVIAKDGKGNVMYAPDLKLTIK